MAWLCGNLFVNNATGNITGYINNGSDWTVDSPYNYENNSYMLSNSSTNTDTLTYVFIVRQIITPLICFGGIIGNIVTLLVFIKRLREAGEMLERGSLVGMIGKLAGL